MPFKSKSQRRWMFATHPKMARRWAEHTPKGSKLPEKVAEAFVYELAKLAFNGGIGTKTIKEGPGAVTLYQQLVGKGAIQRNIPKKPGVLSRIRKRIGRKPIFGT